MVLSSPRPISAGIERLCKSMHGPHAGASYLPPREMAAFAKPFQKMRKGLGKTPGARVGSRCAWSRDLRFMGISDFAAVVISKLNLRLRFNLMLPDLSALCSPDFAADCRANLSGCQTFGHVAPAGERSRIVWLPDIADLMSGLFPLNVARLLVPERNHSAQPQLLQSMI